MSSHEFRSLRRVEWHSLYPDSPHPVDRIRIALSEMDFSEFGGSPVCSLAERIGIKRQFNFYECNLGDPLLLIVLGWACRQNPPALTARTVLFFILKASQQLRSKISWGSFSASDVFASNLIGWVTYSTCCDELDARIHFKGSVGILSALLDTAIVAGHASDPVSHNLMVFGPFIIDCANAWSVRNGQIPHRSTSFNQRVAYFNELSTGPKAGVWYSGILEAANMTLGNLFEICLFCASQVTRHESEGVARRPIDDALEYIRSELGDRDFHIALLAIHSSFEGPNQDHTTVEGQLITRLFHRLRAVLLLHSILDADSIQEGIATERSIMLGTGLIQACHTHAIRRDGPIEDYYLISWHNYSLLLLGGMTLCYGTSANCNVFTNRANVCSMYLGYS